MRPDHRAGAKAAPDKLFSRAISFVLALCLCAALCVGGALAADMEDGSGIITCETASDEMLGAYVCVTVSDRTPYVFVPTGAGSADASDYSTVAQMAASYGARWGITAAVNGGIFYNAGTPTQYCFSYKQPDGMVIAGGVVLKSTESIDHSECDILVIDEDGGIGWTEYWADADALTAGTGHYYDMYGRPVTGKRIVSAVTGFVPILVGGAPVYDENDELLHGYDNYVGHYAQSAVRQIIGVKEDGTIVLLSNLTGWTLEQAAKAALREDCVFAYNLDGGGSAETVLVEEDGSVRIVREQSRGERTMPTYIVFTDDDSVPVSAIPLFITASQNKELPAGAALSDIAAALTVNEYLLGADGSISTRVLHSAQASAGVSLSHAVVDASGEIRRTSVSPPGELYYVKSEADTALSLKNNANTRADGAYYDYSTGFVVSSQDDLTGPGEKRVEITYAPGVGFSPLTVAVPVLLT